MYCFQFIFFRFLVAFSVSGVFECGFVLVSKFKLRSKCGSKVTFVNTILGYWDCRSRTENTFRNHDTGAILFLMLTYFLQFPFGIGASLLPLVAYFIKDWTRCCFYSCFLFCPAPVSTPSSSLQPPASHLDPLLPAGLLLLDHSWISSVAGHQGKEQGDRPDLSQLLTMFAGSPGDPKESCSDQWRDSSWRWRGQLFVVWYKRASRARAGQWKPWASGRFSLIQPSSAGRFITLDSIYGKVFPDLLSTMFGRFHWPLMSFKNIGEICCLEDN